MRVHGVAVFPADTVYGLACEPDSAAAVERLYRLKGRRPEKPAAVMFFDLRLALAALDELPTATREALQRLLPGPVTALLPNPVRRFPLACTGDPQTLGLRVPRLQGGPAEALGEVAWPVLQSSANVSDGPEARRVEDVDERVRAGVDMILDGGELPGIPSTVLDLTRYHQDRSYRIVRAGALSPEAIEAALR